MEFVAFASSYIRGIQVDRTRLINILLVLLIVLLVILLGQVVWHLLSDYADILLLFLLGWLVSFILNPLVNWLGNNSTFRVPRAASIAVIYLGFAVVITLAIIFIAPTAIAQLTDLARNLPKLVAQAPPMLVWLQDQIDRTGLRINIEDAARVGLASLQGYAATLVQNALGIFTSVLGVVANFLFVLILGFYFTLDGPRLREVLSKLIPSAYKDEAHVFAVSVDRTFGGFMRGQLIQAIAIGVGTAIAMTVFGLNFVLVISLFSGLVMLIPLVGPFLSLVPPLVVALFQAPNIAAWIVIALFVYQFVVINIIMPRFLSDSLGMHPLLVLFAILISVKVAGFWGAFFGIPIIGVIWAMGEYLYERWQTN
jgi:predicted PurR-regulated permease PerM